LLLLGDLVVAVAVAVVAAAVTVTGDGDGDSSCGGGGSLMFCTIYYIAQGMGYNTIPYSQKLHGG